MRHRVTKGGVVGRLEVDNPGPPPLTPFLLVVVAWEGGEERGAAGGRGHALAVVFQGRCPPGDGCGGDAHRGWRETDHKDITSHISIGFIVMVCIPTRWNHGLCTKPKTLAQNIKPLAKEKWSVLLDPDLQWTVA